MFTGIIKATGTIAAIDRTGGDVRLSVCSSGLPFSSYALGESIAVNGACLTATALRDDGFDTDVSTETISVTSLCKLVVGSTVNLEPSLSLGDRLGATGAGAGGLGGENVERMRTRAAKLMSTVRDAEALADRGRTRRRLDRLHDQAARFFRVDSEGETVTG